MPALILGAVLRFSYLAAVPEAFYGSDSNSYFVTARAAFVKHHFELPAKRRFVYPLLLVAAPPIPFCTTVQVVAFVQHLAGLAMIFGVGWIAGHFVRRPNIWVPIIAFLPAIWPRMLYYEHEMICETLLLGVFIAAVAVAAPRDALASDRRLIWFCLLALLIVAVKPAGRPIWLGLIVAAIFITQRPFRWPKLCFATVPGVILLTLTSGSDSQGPWLFLSSTLPLVRTEGEPYAAERAMLKPAIESARQDLPNYAFRQGPYKKMLSNNREDNALGEDYIKFVSDRQRFAKVAKTLAREAVIAHPFQYFGMVCKKIVSAVGDQHVQARLDPKRFWREQGESSSGRWEERPEEMQLIYEMDEPAYNAFVAERSTRTLWFTKYTDEFDRLKWLDTKVGKKGESPRTHIKTMGWLALLGFAASLLPYRFRRGTLLWLPALLYLFIIYAIGDTVTRYIHPVEWAGFILIAIGLDSVIDGLVWLYRRVRPVPATEASAPEAATIAV
ncbi:MAG TPA: hypothetical protein VK961_28855 [Chthoniobacter sp.]|nr:hypothetical protein [Chthoniobacter sp.]